MSASFLRSVLSRATNPAIIPIPPRSTGNNVPKSLHKTRRTWQPNVKRVDWNTNALPFGPSPAAETSASGAGASTVLAGGKIRGVKMQVRRRKDVEKAGGIEGLLMSRSAKKLTPFGQRLRSALFDELHRLRDSSQVDRAELMSTAGQIGEESAGVLGRSEANVPLLAASGAGGPSGSLADVGGTGAETASGATRRIA